MRTGTHYFARGVSSVVEQNRHKFALNKIDEATGGTELINGALNGVSHIHHRRTESLSCEMGRRHFINGNTADASTNGHIVITKSLVAAAAATTGLSPDVQRRLALYKAMECENICLCFLCKTINNIIVAPSPRQRCRIRTNPWFSSIDQPTPAVGLGLSKRNDMETSSTSSGIKSSSDAGIEDKPG